MGGNKRETSLPDGLELDFYLTAMGASMTPAEHESATRSVSRVVKSVKEGTRTGETSRIKKTK